MTPGLDEDKFFIVGRGDIQARHDPFFYLPKFVRLEQRVLKKTQLKLRDFIKALAGGATPRTEEQERYYADSETGIPFVRVQNLSVSGELDLTDVKYINAETHNVLLARSQVTENDLLVKITGVGRMAVSSIPPLGFEGNINQHIACIKTKNRHTSEILAAYLNTDIAESLAKRRSTGGTRPALDYGALRSIPIIEDERILPAMTSAYTQYKRMLRQASKKLGEIDDYLLLELGIILPAKPENTIDNRLFSIPFRELTGNRFDPFFNNLPSIGLQQHLVASGAVRLHSLVQQITKGETPLWRGDDYQKEGIPFLRAQNISPDGLIGDVLKIDENVDKRMARSKLFGGEILYTMAGTIGVSCIYPESLGRANINQAIAKIVLNPSNEHLKYYLVEILNSTICRRQAQRALTVAAQPNINFGQIKSILIPLPKDEMVLDKIVEKCKSLRHQAQQLREQAEAELNQAKQQIESMLLGEANP